MEQINILLEEAKDKMSKALENLRGKMSGIRAGRVSADMLNNISIDLYGSPSPINRAATISLPDPRTIVIEPWDKSILRDIEKAIQTSDLGVNPNNDGKIIRVIFPPLTEERRKQFVKVAKEELEEGKISVRNVRKQIKEKLEKLEKDKLISEDMLRGGSNKLQTLTDEWTKKMEEMFSKKEKEILGSEQRKSCSFCMFNNKKN